MSKSHIIEKNLDITLSENQKKQFQIYYEYLIEMNEKINLTAITDEEEVYIKHFVDSLALQWIKPLKDQKILDVGAGAGFPSIPLKIIYPNLKVTILDAQKKRINFLQNLTDKLGIEVTLLHKRAEEYEFKETFDLVTARAVAKLNILLELCVPFLKVDGHFIAYKGPNYFEEMNDAKAAINRLNTKINNEMSFILHGHERALIDIKKTAKTPGKYPRPFKKIKSNPL